MFVAGFPAAALGTNCYVVAPDAGEECVIIDPGVGVADRLAELVDRWRLRPVAVLATHGHFDHTMSIGPICGARGIPAYIHPADRGMLADPMVGLPADWAGALRQLAGGTVATEPEDVVALADGAVVPLAGLEFTVDHAPGHTPGSVLFGLPGGVRTAAGDLPAADDLVGASALCFSGDVLFAGSIGRVDLPGGSEAEMADTLRRVVLARDDTVSVLPGHGPHTSIGAERRVNPYLARLAADPAAGPLAG